MKDNQSRAVHLDSMLAGLAMLDAYSNRDTDTLASLLDATPPGEAIDSLLASMEVMCGIFATQIGADTTQVIASVRRRIVAEIADPQPPKHRRGDL